MAEKKIIEVQVRESGVDELNKKLERTEQNLSDVRRESAKTESAVKSVGENGGAMATLDELTGGLATKFKNAAEGAKLFGNVTKGALIATGIGAFVVALGTIVAYWDEIKAAVTGVDESLEGQLKKSQALSGVLEAQMTLLDEQLRIAKENNEATGELLEAKRKLAELQLTELDYQRLSLENQLSAAIIEAQRQTFWENFTGQKAKATDEEIAQIAELEKQLLQLEVTYLKIQQTISGTTGGTTTSEGRDKLSKINPITGESYQAQLDAEAAFFRKQFDLKKSNDAELLKSALATTKRFVQIEKFGTDARVKFAELEAEQKQELLFSTAAGLMAFADLVGQTTGVGKALATAGAITNTWLGVSEVLSTKSVLPEPLATVARIANIATVVATGLGAVRQINSVQVPNANISSSYFGSVSSGGSAPAVQTPSFNIVGDSGQNQLVDAIREQTGNPIRAYVVQDDLRSASDLDRQIRSAASLG